MATGAAPEPPGEAPGGGRGVASGFVPPRRLSDELGIILREFEVEAVTLREVMRLLHGRGYVLLIVFLALPFATPVSVPGLSMPLGMIIALIGARLAFGAKPWLPQRLLDLQLPPKVFAKVFAAARKIVRGFEKLLRPRLLWVTGTPRREQAHALPIVACALMLLMPLPVPLSNILPAWGVLLVAGGLLERDGAFIIAGYAATLLATVFFGALALLGKEAVDVVWGWFGFGA